MIQRLIDRVAILLCALIICAGAAMPAGAQDDRFGGSYLTPFPSNDTYQVLIVGDTFAEGMLQPLSEALATDKRINFQRRMAWLGGVSKSDFNERLAEIERRLTDEAITVAIVMVGEDDRGPIRIDRGQRIQPDTPEWRQEYAIRIDKLAKLLRRRSVPAYWVGLPIMSRPEADATIQSMNDVIREKSYLSGHKYIDAYAGFSDENGGYSAYGPDLTGKIRALRSGNGDYFSGAGNRKLAHFVEKELRRDLKQARSERAVPLAGDAGEQARINPVAAPSDTDSGNANGDSDAAKAGVTASRTPAALFAPLPTAQASTDASGSRQPANADLSNETSVVAIKTVGRDGQPQAFAAEIVRPPVPGSVVAAMTRRDNAQRATQLGDLVIDQLSGGLTIMASITPPQGGVERAKLSPTQSPSFRLLVKGETLSSKPGRADDFAWTPPVTSGP